ncbi:MAG: helix-turn-helix transcriptional regulator [Lachnospiraceae bacterium]|nr:helix-turn-helix transcriptional regulator [Lachnospiraceae bacterium]
MQTRIRKLRQENSYTQEYLAMKVGITQTSLSRIESGQSIPDAQLLIRLSDVFQVSTDYLLYRSDQRLPESEAQINTSDPSQRLHHHLSLIQGLNPNQLTHLQHFLESIQAIY